MRTFEVEQAVFASSGRGNIKGYQLVARSAGVDRSTAQTLCRWAPTQVPSDDPNDWTINYFPIDEELVAVSRTVLGGPEYSGRGGTQVVTVSLILRDVVFQAYSCNPMLVARTAMAIGLLRLPLHLEHDQFPLAKLPGQPLVQPRSIPETADGAHDSDIQLRLLTELVEAIRNEQRVAVIGADCATEFVERLVPKLPTEIRRRFSFTTGLSPSVRRPFQAHFLADTDLVRQRTLEAQNITRFDITARSKPIEIDLKASADATVA